MNRDGPVPGVASLHVVGGTVLLRPEEQVAEAMLAGGRNQQLARNLAHSTIEGRQNAVKAFTHDELQAFSDYADDQVHRISGAGRKGWLPAFRDATLFKTAYTYGLRRRETRMLDLIDFGANPHAPIFGDIGVCYVRWGKAMKGSPPKRRSVLTVEPRDEIGGMDWVVDTLDQWVTEVRPAFAQAATSPASGRPESAQRRGFRCDPSDPMMVLCALRTICSGRPSAGWAGACGGCAMSWRRLPSPVSVACSGRAASVSSPSPCSAQRWSTRSGPPSIGCGTGGAWSG
ncbi:hypothetical protein SAMN04489712_1312 [Thermomonospora echinospora]|uniref:Tyr recombinase domain-containing protein n=1 Tax=Thermomonospora echinospora TaxID=1992 RepID=A0A1H6E4P9_9ACTN|nr:hypothetical protein [Thermomonospora echinospora]SEG91855.1 hypothetical protein SAMN04489712_1312 [Thermomonospora echinospora]